MCIQIIEERVPDRVRVREWNEIYFKFRVLGGPWQNFKFCIRFSSVPSFGGVKIVDEEGNEYEELEFVWKDYGTQRNSVDLEYRVRFYVTGGGNYRIDALAAEQPDLNEAPESCWQKSYTMLGCGGYARPCVRVEEDNIDKNATTYSPANFSMTFFGFRDFSNGVNFKITYVQGSSNEVIWTPESGSRYAGRMSQSESHIISLPVELEGCSKFGFNGTMSYQYAGEHRFRITVINRSDNEECASFDVTVNVTGEEPPSQPSGGEGEQPSGGGGQPSGGGEQPEGEGGQPPTQPSEMVTISVELIKSMIRGVYVAITQNNNTIAQKVLYPTDKTLRCNLREGSSFMLLAKVVPSLSPLRGATLLVDPTKITTIQTIRFGLLIRNAQGGGS